MSSSTCPGFVSSIWPRGPVSSGRVWQGPGEPKETSSSFSTRIPSAMSIGCRPFWIPSRKTIAPPSALSSTWSTLKISLTGHKTKVPVALSTGNSSTNDCPFFRKTSSIRPSRSKVQSWLAVSLPSAKNSFLSSEATTKGSKFGAESSTSCHLRCAFHFPISFWFFSLKLFSLFQIWQCGGSMLDAPCSRIGHIYRKYAPFPNNAKGDFVGRVN